MIFFPFSAYEPDLELSQVMAAVSDMTDAEYTDWIAAGQPDVHTFLLLRSVSTFHNTVSHSATKACECTNCSEQWAVTRAEKK